MVIRLGFLLCFIVCVLLPIQRPYFLEFPYLALFALGYVIRYFPSVRKQNIDLSDFREIFSQRRTNSREIMRD